MTRLNRLSRYQYARLSPQQKQAVDWLEFGRPSAASRGEAKTVLRWRRTREETVAAYALTLLEQGLMIRPVADRLGIGERYLRRLLEQESETSKNGPATPLSKPPSWH